jgi:hypothetical protein
LNATWTFNEAGHSFTNYVSDGNATCLEDGTETAKCDRCDETKTQTEVGSALDHSFTNYVSNGDATCLVNGTQTAKCDRCDAKDTIPDIGSALGYTEKFKSDVKNVVGIQGSDAYFALYTALETYALLTDAEKAEVSEEYAALCTAIQAYNTTATEVNHIADEATEIALAPLCAAGFSFLAALWLLIQKKFGV